MDGGFGAARTPIPAWGRGVSVEPEFILFVAALVLTAVVVGVVVLLLRRAFREEREGDRR